MTFVINPWQIKTEKEIRKHKVLLKNVSSCHPADLQ